MAAVYSRVFASQQGLNGAIDLTVPAGKVWIIRDFDGYVSNLGATTLRLIDKTSGGTFFVDSQIDPSAHWSSWRGRQVFEAGQIVEINTDVPYDVRLSGYELDA